MTYLVAPFGSETSPQAR